MEDLRAENILEDDESSNVMMKMGSVGGGAEAEVDRSTKNFRVTANPA